MLKTTTILVSALCALATPVFAKQYGAQTGLISIEVLQGWRTETGNHMAAIRIALEDGWKTYWRAPGGIGIPPTFSWKGSKNLASVQIHWPSPKVYVQDGIRTIGYKGELILPVEITPLIKGQTIKVKSQVQFGVCSDVCIPVTSRIEAVLPHDAVSHKDVINAALVARPVSGKASGVRSVSCQVDPTADGLKITANIRFKQNAPNVQQAVIEYSYPSIWIEQATLKQSGKSMTAKADLVSYSSDPFFLDRSKLRLTLIGKARAIEIVGCPAPG